MSYIIMPDFSSYVKLMIIILVSPLTLVEHHTNLSNHFKIVCLLEKLDSSGKFDCIYENMKGQNGSERGWQMTMTYRNII